MDLSIFVYMFIYNIYRSYFIYAYVCVCKHTHVLKWYILNPGGNYRWEGRTGVLMTLYYFISSKKTHRTLPLTFQTWRLIEPTSLGLWVTIMFHIWNISQFKKKKQRSPATVWWVDWTEVMLGGVWPFRKWHQQPGWRAFLLSFWCAVAAWRTWQLWLSKLG